MLKWFAGVAMTATVLLSMNAAMAETTYKDVNLNWSVKTSCKGPSPKKIDDARIFKVKPNSVGPCKTDKVDSGYGKSVRQELNTSVLPNGEYVFDATYDLNAIPNATRMTIFQLHAGESNKRPPLMVSYNKNGCLVAYTLKSSQNIRSCDKPKKFTLRVEWKTGKDGYVRMYQNGQLFHKRYQFDLNGNRKNVYAKWGFYGIKLKNELIMKVSNVRLRRVVH